MNDGEVDDLAWFPVVILPDFYQFCLSGLVFLGEFHGPVLSVLE